MTLGCPILDGVSFAHPPAILLPNATRQSLLVLSDMHLGSDIVDRAAPRPPARSQSVDDDLCALLDHYRDARTGGDPWHLVINGDFIDFMGISIGTAGTPLST